MYLGNRILGLVPARGGSKGIHHKNIVEICGKPLIAYTIEAANNCKYIDSVVVSTDDYNIAKIAKEYGAKVPFMRPEELASDKSRTVDSVLHAIKVLSNNDDNYEVLVLLQPTSPLRTTIDIDEAIVRFFKNGRIPLASVCEVNDHPLLIRRIYKNRLVSIVGEPSTCRRQDMPAYYKVNGAIYINNIDMLNDSTSFNDNSEYYIMEKSHSVDVDNNEDLAVAEYYLSAAKQI